MVEATYVETDCTFAHGGRTFEAGGAVVTPTFATGYLCAVSQTDKRLVLKNWHGTETLGPARVVSRWKVRNGVFSDEMMQVEVTINGRTYTGRSGGVGMVWRGRPKRGH